MHFMLRKSLSQILRPRLRGEIGIFLTKNRFWLKPTVGTAGKLGMPEQERRQLAASMMLQMLQMLP